MDFLIELSAGSAPILLPTWMIQAALQAKYTARGRDLPANGTRGQVMDRLDMLESLLKLDPRGISRVGMRNEHLRCTTAIGYSKCPFCCLC